MSYAIVLTFGTPPSGVITDAQWVTFITSLAAALTGKAGTNDIEPGAITASRVTPDKFCWAASSYDAGTNTYTINTLNGTGMPPGNGVHIFFKAAPGATCAAGPVYANVNSQGAVKVVSRGAHLKQGDIRANRSYMIIRGGDDAGNPQWEMLSLPTNAEVHVQSAATTGTNDYVVTMDPTILALNAAADGLTLTWKVPNANTGACRLNVDGLGLKAIKKYYNTALDAGDLVAGQWVTVVYDNANDWFLLVTPTAIPDRDSAIVADARNLVIKNNGAAPNNKLDITADEVVLRSTTAALRVTSVSVTVDITASGVNGLDTGAEGASTFYHVWLISNGSATASLLSTSATAPTLPAGYTFKALVGVVLNDAGSNFVTQYQQGRVIQINEFNIMTASGASVANTYQSLSLSGTVPPIAKRVFGSAGTSSTANPSRLTVAGDANGLGAVNIMGQQLGAAVNGFTCAGYYIVPMPTPQSIYWKSSVTTGDYRLNVSGYEI